MLPQDVQVQGFDNIAAALTVSPSLISQYITAARHVAQFAIGNPTARVSNVKYSIAAIKILTSPCRWARAAA